MRGPRSMACSLRSTAATATCQRLQAAGQDQRFLALLLPLLDPVACPGRICLLPLSSSSVELLLPSESDRGLLSSGSGGKLVRRW